ncbi:SidA/IucD/PvdA family monooxygenase [Streptomyces sp. NBC_01477]|uniref:SidA/IucD/PvdA family monooxygenase n=1 Tax=Streptomyces sp. NBC_01477 TaxID=2976015 RepID=UPI002E37E7A5|nr:SidA/IucD/PvdA family monooxygenase [Streptomyces sp. NBC_01477]
MHRRRPGCAGSPGPARSPRWSYSRLGLEHFTPDYTRHFHDLPAAVHDRLVGERWQLYKAASTEILADVHDHLYQATVGRPVDANPVEIVPGTAAATSTADPDGTIELRCRHADAGTGA